MRHFFHSFALCRCFKKNILHLALNETNYRSISDDDRCDIFLKLSGVQRLEWPPMYPDLSCIEHLWDILGRAINKHINQHTRLADLQNLPLQEWAAIPQRQIQRLVNSMRRRLNECRVNFGGYTHY